MAVAVVCDGVSTTRRPDEASLAAAQAAVRVLLDAARTGHDLAESSRNAVSAAREAVIGLDDAPGDSPLLDPPSATFVSAVMTSRGGDPVLAGRQPRLLARSRPGTRRRAARPVTTRWPGRWWRRACSSETEALALPQAHVVTGWVGPRPRTVPPPHVARFEPPGPGVLLLCSDGLWNYQPEAAKLAELALPGALTEPLAAAAALVEFALESGGMDNVTVVLAPFPPGTAQPASDHPATAPAPYDVIPRRRKPDESARLHR